MTTCPGSVSHLTPMTCQSLSDTLISSTEPPSRTTHSEDHTAPYNDATRFLATLRMTSRPHSGETQRFSGRNIHPERTVPFAMRERRGCPGSRGDRVSPAPRGKCPKDKGARRGRRTKRARNVPRVRTLVAARCGRPCPLSERKGTRASAARSQGYARGGRGAARQPNNHNPLQRNATKPLILPSPLRGRGSG